MEWLKLQAYRAVTLLYRAWLLFLAVVAITLVSAMAIILYAWEGPPKEWKNDTLYPSGWERKWLNSRL